MTTALLNIRLDYDQVLALVQQLSDEDKLRLKDELIAETAKRIIVILRTCLSQKRQNLSAQKKYKTKV